MEKKSTRLFIDVFRIKLNCYFKLNLSFERKKIKKNIIEIIPNNTKNEIELNSPLEILIIHNSMNENLSNLTFLSINKFINCKKENAMIVNPKIENINLKYFIIRCYFLSN